MTEGEIRVVAAVIRREGRVLLASRPPDKPPPGWEFPGGKIEPGESPEGALVRELREELGVRVIPGELLESSQHGRIVLYFISTVLPEGEIPVPREGQRCFWIDPGPEPPPELLPADRDFWLRLVRRR